jgi:hypothetical protein
LSFPITRSPDLPITRSGPPPPTPMFIPVGPIVSHPIPRLSASAEGRNVKAPCFAAHAVAFPGQKLRANSQKPNCQISFPAHTLGRCRSIAPFVRLFNCEIGHVPDSSIVERHRFRLPFLLLTVAIGVPSRRAHNGRGSRH